MKVVRVELDAPACSFRYPHFLVGQQLTFDMPPPSTIFGHVASGLGSWPARDSFRFAYWFSAMGNGNDREKQHIITPSSSRVSIAGEKVSANVEVSIQPVSRQFLFGVKMILYVDNESLLAAFNSPRFPVILGRSQDLASYGKIDTVELEMREAGYFENTLLPFEFRKYTSRGVSILLPKYVDRPPMRAAVFSKYIMLKEHIFYGAEFDAGTKSMMAIEGDRLRVWVDPESPTRNGLNRALAFHGFV